MKDSARIVKAIEDYYDWFWDELGGRETVMLMAGASNIKLRMDGMSLSMRELTTYVFFEYRIILRDGNLIRMKFSGDRRGILTSTAKGFLSSSSFNLSDLVSYRNFLRIIPIKTVEFNCWRYRMNNNLHSLGYCPQVARRTVKDLVGLDLNPLLEF
jgi:hypothetical protein